MNFTDYHVKWFAHEITRRYPANNAQKLTSVLYDAKVDLNPHQIDAALFAFKSPLAKGVILADEVGLGKTIEAGLVIAQKWSEGKRKILIITPSNLRTQWLYEMKDKFYLPAMILESKNFNDLRRAGIRNPFEQPSLVICSYNFAASKDYDLKYVSWDLVVIDEAHRLRNVYKPSNKIGNALKHGLKDFYKILLTATPLQNSLLELYGLVSIIDDHAFGDVKSFKNQYSRVTDSELHEDLKERLRPLCHRTLRRQVREYVNYTNRIAKTHLFEPTAAEERLYNEVSEYLRRPNIMALPPGQRKLMTLVMRKLLASSTFAIAGALDSLARRLEEDIKRRGPTSIALEEEIAADYESYNETVDEWDEEEEEEELKPLTEEDCEAIRKEILELKEFRDLAVSITKNARGTALLTALQSGFEHARNMGSPEKVLIFTESKRTQEYLVKLLSNSGYAGQLLLFNGSNSDPQSTEIYRDWLKKYEGTDRITGSKSADMRSALVDYFRNSARIMIATEAAAEGVNLQFCSIVVNYDLPWNPQRIEQRIGRCHRYGQKHDVVVINFLNKKNAADQRVYELLDQKFALFNGVFGASDEVLGAIESGVEIEKRIVEFYQKCRTVDEIEAEYARLRADLDNKIDEAMRNTRRKLLEYFDAEVHERLRVNCKDSKEYLDKHKSLLWDLTRHELKGHAEFDKDKWQFSLKKPISGLEVPTGIYKLGQDEHEAYHYRIGHPIAQHLIRRAAVRDLPGAHLQISYSGSELKATSIETLVGKKGILGCVKLKNENFDPEDHIIFCGLTEEGQILNEDQILRMLSYPSKITKEEKLEWSIRILDQVSKRRNEILERLSDRNANWFEDECDKLEKWADDQKKSLSLSLKDYDDEIKELNKIYRSTKNMQDKINIKRKQMGVETKRDQTWKKYDEEILKIINKKEELLDNIQDKLKDQILEEKLFLLRWHLV